MANGDNAKLAIMIATELFRFYQQWRNKAKVAGATDAEIDAAIKKFNPDNYPDPLSFEPPPEVPQTDPKNDDGSTAGDGLYYTTLEEKPERSSLKSGDRVYQKQEGTFFVVPGTGPGISIPSSWVIVMRVL